MREHEIVNRVARKVCRSLYRGVLVDSIEQRWHPRNTAYVARKAGRIGLNV